MVINWSNSFECERRRNISIAGKLGLGGKQIVPVYYIKWTPTSQDSTTGVVEFDFSPISKIPVSTSSFTVNKRANVIKKTKELMTDYMKQVFGDAPIPELFGSSVETTRIVMIVEDNVITGIASQDLVNTQIAEAKSLNGSFGTFKKIVEKVNDATDESLFAKES